MSKSILFEQFTEKRANFLIFYKTYDWRLETAAIGVYKKKHPQVILNQGNAWKCGRGDVPLARVVISTATSSPFSVFEPFLNKNVIVEPDFSPIKGKHELTRKLNESTEP